MEFQGEKDTVGQWNRWKLDSHDFKINFDLITGQDGNDNDLLHSIQRSKQKINSGEEEAKFLFILIQVYEKKIMKVTEGAHIKQW